MGSVKKRVLELEASGLPPGPHSLSHHDAAEAAVDFAGQQAISFRIENRTSDPVSPMIGQIWLRTDLV